MSPDSQCLPTTRTSAGSASLAREAMRTEYCAPYNAGRALSLMPPSTLTYRRVSPSSRVTGLVVPTEYSVTPARPTMERPGSKARSGIGMPRAAHSAATASTIPRARSSIGVGSSAAV